MSKRRELVASNLFQKKYKYELIQPIGRNFDKKFKPDLTPKEMLKMGVFGGAYFIGVKGLIPKDLPKSWFKGVKISKDGIKHPDLNYYKIEASQPLSVWKQKGWISKYDPHGWFEWYCRYYLGRRIPEEDKRQVKRWNAIKRHVGAVVKNCRAKDLSCRRKQRQAILHWAIDSTKI
jgi:hypothetical protein